MMRQSIGKIFPGENIKNIIDSIEYFDYKKLYRRLLWENDNRSLGSEIIAITLKNNLDIISNKEINWWGYICPATGFVYFENIDKIFSVCVFTNPLTSQIVPSIRLSSVNPVNGKLTTIAENEEINQELKLCLNLWTR